MARVPTLENQTRGLSPLQAARPQLTPRTGLQSIGAALGDVGQVAQQIRQQEQLKADQTAFMEADRALGENENAILNDPTSGALNVRGKDAMDITSKALEEFDIAASKAQQGLTTDRQRRVFAESLQQRRQGIERQLQRHESNERESYYASEREAYKQSAQSAAISNFRDPVRIEQEIEKARSAIDQTPGLSAEQRSAELSQRRSAVYGGVVDRFLANDEVGSAEAYYSSVKDRVDGETATNIERAIRVAKDRQEAKKESGLSLARAELQDEIRDIESAFRLRIPVTQVPSEARFVALYGERGRKMHEQTKLMADASIDSAKLTQLPTSDVARIAGGYTPKQVQGSARRAEVASIIQQQASVDLRERQEDPAGYLVRHSHSVRATWDDFSNGGDVNRYITAVRGEQERLGLPSGDLLPDAYADEVAARITQSGAEGMTGMIQSEAARWGSAWPEVYGQLAPKMTDIAAVIGSGIPTYAADALASTAGLKTVELQAMIPPGVTKSDVDTAVAETFADFNRSFPVDAARTVGAFADSAVRLTIRYMQQGMSRSDAAQKAYTDLTGNYTLNDHRGVTYRVPRQYDASAVEDGADTLLREYVTQSDGIETNLLPGEELRTWDGYPAVKNSDGSFSTRITATVEVEELNGGKPTNIPTLWRGQKLSDDEAIREAIDSGLEFPRFDTVDEAVQAAKDLSESIRRPPPLFSEEELKDQYNTYIRNNAYWMTAPDESGLRLYVDGGPVVDSGGPVQHSWDDITLKGAETRAKRKELSEKQRADAVEMSRQPGLR